MAREDVAIIGMACRLPGARNAGELWDNLCAGRSSERELSDEAALRAGVPASALGAPTYVRTAYAVDGAEEFDARFFAIRPDEARAMDPQQRLALEVAYEALEDAACVIRAQKGTTAVFASAGGVASSYLLHFAGRFGDQPCTTGSLVHLVNDKDFLATRLSFKLNLTGPSMSVQTACSSSLVAVHLARMSLLAGECDFAVVGASCIRVPLGGGYVAADNPVLSPTGRCRAFSDDADGTVFGSGVLAVVLERQSDAHAHGDHVYAVIKSTAVTNDGAAKVGYTASSVPGQARAMMRAIADAGVTCRDISYVECHGTATKIGDPLETKALERVFRIDTPERGFCGIGSVKTNIGHAEQGAGLASLIKLALMLKKRTLVPSCHFRRPNPKLGLEGSPFFVVRETRAWTAGDGEGARPLTAGINCLGIGGTNAFAVLSEPSRPAGERASSGRAGVSAAAGGEALEIVCLSAKTSEQLGAYLDRMVEILDANRDVSARDFCYTVNVSRSHHRLRCCAVVSERVSAADALRAARESLAPFEGPAPRQTLYVCNPRHPVNAETAAALASDPRFSAFRERYRELSSRLHAARPGASGDLAELLDTLAFEVALYAQLAAWGIAGKEVAGVGFGGLVRRVIEAQDAEKVLQGVLAELDQEIDLGAAWEATGAERAPATHFVIYRSAPAAATAAVAPGGSVAIESAGEPVTIRAVLVLLARCLEHGLAVDWECYYRDVPRRAIPLPTYPFARERHWLGD